MLTKKDVCLQVLAGLGTEKLTLNDAVAKAEAIKPLKNKNKTGTWKYHFALHGTVREDETGVYVSANVAVPTPVLVAPVV